MTERYTGAMTLSILFTTQTMPRVSISLDDLDRAAIKPVS
jgi:hypothetical protein